VLQQPPQELHSLIDQQLMLETVLLGEGKGEIDVPALKKSVKDVSSQVKTEADFDRLEPELFKKHSKGQLPPPKPASPAPPPAAKPPTPVKKEEKSRATS
jgi:hypothetical protein